MHLYALLRDYTISINLSVLIYVVWILFVHIFVFFSNLLGYFACVIIISFACSLILFTLSMMSCATWSCKSCSWLLCIDSSPFDCAAYLTWHCLYFTFLRDFGILHHHVCECVISIQSITRHNMPGVSFSAPLDGSNLITFLMPVTISCVTIIILSVVMC